MLGVKFKGGSNFIDLEQAAGENKLTVGAAAGFLSAGIFGVEAEVAFTPGFFQRSGGGNFVAGSHVATVMGGVIVAAPRSIVGESLRPYVSGAIGLIDVGISDLIDLASVDSRLLGMSVGAGAIGPIGRGTAMRFDLRYVRSLGSSDDAVVFGETQISFWRAGVGMMFRY